MTLGVPLFRKIFPPKPFPLGAQPRAGEIYGFVHENSRTGLERNLFWNIRVEFESVPFDGEQWDCSLGIEWLTFPIRRWRDLDGMSLARAHSRSLLECSLYLFEEHHWARLNRLEMKEVSPGIFEVDFAAIADVDDGSGLRRFEVSGRCDVKFIGIIVVPDNLDPKPETAEAAATTVAHFLALDDLDEPRSEQWRFVLDPST